VDDFIELTHAADRASRAGNVEEAIALHERRARWLEEHGLDKHARKLRAFIETLRRLIAHRNN
jgi:hypothetical protein